MKKKTLIFLLLVLLVALGGCRLSEASAPQLPPTETPTLAPSPQEMYITEMQPVLEKLDDYEAASAEWDKYMSQESYIRCLDYYVNVPVMYADQNCTYGGDDLTTGAFKGTMLPVSNKLKTLEYDMYLNFSLVDPPTEIKRSHEILTKCFKHRYDAVSGVYNLLAHGSKLDIPDDPICDYFPDAFKSFLEYMGVKN